VDENKYLYRPDLTATQFLTDLFATYLKNGWGRMYRTRDYGRLDARGFLTVEGRIDGDTQSAAWVPYELQRSSESWLKKPAGYLHRP